MKKTRKKNKRINKKTRRGGVYSNPTSPRVIHTPDYNKINTLNTKQKRLIQLAAEETATKAKKNWR